MTAVRRRGGRRPPVPLAHKLVLNRWLLGLFEVPTFGDLLEPLRRDELEGLDETYIHRFHYALAAQFPQLRALPQDVLLAYEHNISAITRRVNSRRLTSGAEPIVWKHFQYLSLLFTEIYLDRYFAAPATLLGDIAQTLAECNEDLPAADQLKTFDGGTDPAEQLNKLSYWSATGSGKTLLMHAHLLQYQQYLAATGRARDLNRIILLTPNEGLSRQHLEAFRASGLDAELLERDGPGLFAGRAVEIIDIHKLRDEMGARTIAVSAFEDKNLVLIDEGHRGATAGTEGTWLRFRNTLCERGFSFEYSATFGQAVKGNRDLADLYARTILVDYSYRYFHREGFGKDFRVMNLDDHTEDVHLQAYLVACLLSFYQQLRFYENEAASLVPFQVAQPLCVFIGGKVTASLPSREASDIVEILGFLARYLSDAGTAIATIERVLSQGLVTATGQDLLGRHFDYLNMSGQSASQIYTDSIDLVFNAAAGQGLHMENVRGVPGEIALRVGDSPPFGVINVGDDAKLCKICARALGLRVDEREFGESLFRTISDDASPIKILIGSKKFSEGWSSWRVSTMGLMNVGASEGSQIIQLFGRGVRLRGYAMSLKRSTAVALPPTLQTPRHISLLEMLGVFGIRAKYMAQFREFLSVEGLGEGEEELEVRLPAIQTSPLPALKTIRMKNGFADAAGGPTLAFKRFGPRVQLLAPAGLDADAARYLQRRPVVLNWYPKIQAVTSGEQSSDDRSRRHETHLQSEQLAFLDRDALYFGLRRFKSDRGWGTLFVERDTVDELLVDQSWYRLQMPEDALSFDDFANVRVWQDVALALLKKYTQRLYNYRKREWELPHLEYRALAADDPNLTGAAGEGKPEFYALRLDKSHAALQAKLDFLRDCIERGDARPWDFQGVHATWFSRHLYQPLLHLTQHSASITPVALNRGEHEFVADLSAMYERQHEFFARRELYLLRNLSRGKGIGFFEAGEFYPDFLLWIVAGRDQYILFVDPKGIRNLGPDDPKIQFHETVRELEARLGDIHVHLRSFIMSNTPSHVVSDQWGLSKSDALSRGILFQEEDRDTYIRTMLEHALEA